MPQGMLNDESALAIWRAANERARATAGYARFTAGEGERIELHAIRDRVETQREQQVRNARALDLLAEHRALMRTDAGGDDLVHERLRYERLVFAADERDRELRDYARQGVVCVEASPAVDQYAEAVALAEHAARELGVTPPENVRFFRELADPDDAYQALRDGTALSRGDEHRRGFQRDRDIFINVETVPYGSEAMMDTVHHEVFHLARRNAPHEEAYAYGAAAVRNAHAVNYWGDAPASAPAWSGVASYGARPTVSGRRFGVVWTQ